MEQTWVDKTNRLCKLNFKCIARKNETLKCFKSRKRCIIIIKIYERVATTRLKCYTLELPKLPKLIAQCTLG